MSQASPRILDRTSRSDLGTFGQARGCLAMGVLAVLGSQAPYSIATLAFTLNQSNGYEFLQRLCSFKAAS